MPTSPLRPESALRRQFGLLLYAATNPHAIHDNIAAGGTTAARLGVVVTSD